MAKRVGFFRALKLFYKNYVDFTGRSTRAEYWWMYLWRFLYGLVVNGTFCVVFLMYFKNVQRHGAVLVAVVLVLLLCLIIALASIVPSISLLVRRYRDAGVNPILVLVPYVIPNAAFFLLGMPTPYLDPTGLTPNNQFGVYIAIALFTAAFNFIVTVLPSTDKRRFL